MDAHSNVLNGKWKTYVNWTMIYSWILFPLIAITSLKVFPALNEFWLIDDNLFLVVAGAFICSSIIITYFIWFCLATNELFALLAVDKKTRLKANLFIAISLLVFPISVIIMFIYLWLEMGEYWLERMQEHTWLAIARESRIK